MRCHWRKLVWSQLRVNRTGGGEGRGGEGEGGGEGEEGEGGCKTVKAISFSLTNCIGVSVGLIAYQCSPLQCFSNYF